MRYWDTRDQEIRARRFAAIVAALLMLTGWALLEAMQ